MLEQAPPLDKASEFYWNALNELGTTRPPSMGGGLQPIPIDKIIGYAAFLGMTQREADYLVRVVRRVDNYKCNSSADKARKRASKPAK